MISASVRQIGKACVGAGIIPFILLASGCNNSDPIPYEESDISQVTLPPVEQPPVEQPAEDRPPLPAVVASVGGVEITAEEVNAEIDTMLARSQEPLDPQMIEVYRDMMVRQTLDGMVTRILLNQAVAAEGVEVTEEDIDEVVTQITANFPPGMTLDVVLEREQIDPAEFRENLRQDLKINKLLDAKSEGATQPDEESVKAFYEENQEYFQVPKTAEASHILLRTPEEADEAALEAIREQIEGIRQQLLDGADFAELATEHSDCPSSENGGQLGSFGEGQMVPAFEEAAFTQEIDEIGPVVTTPFGYHIIKVTSRQEARTQPLEEVYDTIVGFKQQEQQQEIVGQYIEKLREEGDVTIFIEDEEE